MSLPEPASTTSFIRGVSSHKAGALLLAQGFAVNLSSATLEASATVTARDIDVIEMYGSAVLPGSANLLIEATDQKNGRASLRTDSRLLTLDTPGMSYDTGLVYDSDNIYDGLAGQGSLTGMELVPSRSVSTTILFTDFTPDLDVVPSTSVSKTVELKTDNRLTISGVVSTMLGFSVIEDIVNYTQISPPYDNDGNYNEGLYDPVTGFGPEIFIRIEPSNSVSTEIDVEAILFGFAVNAQASFSFPKTISAQTFNTIEMDSSVSTANVQQVEFSLAQNVSVDTVPSTSNLLPVDESVSVSIDLTPTASSARGFVALAQSIDINQDIFLSSSTSQQTTVDWSRSHNIGVVTQASVSNPLVVLVDEDFEVTVTASPSGMLGRPIASVGGIRDRMGNRLTAGRRAKAFALR